MIYAEFREPGRPFMSGVALRTDHYDIGNVIDQLSLFRGLPSLYMASLDQKVMSIGGSSVFAVPYPVIGTCRHIAPVGNHLHLLLQYLVPDAIVSHLPVEIQIIIFPSGAPAGRRGLSLVHVRQLFAHYQVPSD